MGNLLMPIYMILEYRRQYLSPQLGLRHCLSQYFKEHKSEGILGSEYFEKQSKTCAILGCSWGLYAFRGNEAGTVGGGKLLNTVLLHFVKLVVLSTGTE